MGNYLTVDYNHREKRSMWFLHWPNNSICARAHTILGVSLVNRATVNNYNASESFHSVQLLNIPYDVFYTVYEKEVPLWYFQ